MHETGNWDNYRKVFNDIWPAHVYCVSQYGGKGFIEDVKDELLSKLPAAIATYDGTKPFVPWLRAVTRNICLDEIKKSSRQNLIGGIDLELLPAKTQSALESFERTEELERLYRIALQVLNTRPLHQRVLIILLTKLREATDTEERQLISRVGLTMQSEYKVQRERLAAVLGMTRGNVDVVLSRFKDECRKMAKAEDR